MSTQYISYSSRNGGGVATYPTFSAFPASASDGALAVALDTDTLYVFNLGSATWLALSAPSAVLSIGPIDSQAPGANGATLNVNAFIMQSASTSVPGLVNNTTQSFSGNKTFTGTISASNLSGTNTGDVTLGTANGLSLAGQVLSLQLSDSTHTGALSSTDWNTFNNKQAALIFDAPLVNTANTIDINGNVADNKLSFVNASDATKKFSFDLSQQTTATLLTLQPQNTSNMVLNIPQVATASGAGMVLTQDETTGFIFGYGITSSIGAANSMFQLANATTANRAQIKLHSYFNGASVAGVSTLTSRSGVINTNAAIVAGQDYSKWTAQAAATTAGSAPISGTWSFKANTVNSLTVTSDFHLQLTNLAGTLADRLYLSSEGLLQLPGYSTGVAHFDSSGNITSSLIVNADITNATIDLTSKVTGLLPLANLASLQVNKYFYVDGQRTDSYTADGSSFRPFKTIGAATSQVITNADNNTHPYVIFVAPGAYAETLSFNNSALYNLTYSALANSGDVAIQVTTVTGISSTSNNTQLATLIFNGITVNGNVNLTGDVNGTNFGSSQILFVGCQFNNSSGTIVLNNVNNVNMYGAQIQGTGSVSTFTNVAFGYVEGVEGFVSGTILHLVDNPGGNVPSQYSGNYLLLSGTKFYGTVTIDAGSELDVLESYFGSNSVLTNNGIIHSWSTSWSGTTAITLNNGSTLRSRGDFFYLKPTLSGAPTVQYQGFFGYAPTTSSDWNTVPKFIQDAIDTLATSGIVKSQTQNKVLASPNGSSGVPSFRALVAGDLPAISPSAITLTNTHILVGNASNVAVDVAMSGDATISNTGLLTIANLAITNAKIANATIDLTSKVTGLLPLANGGTNNNITASAGAVVYSDASKLLLSSVGSSGQILQSNGSGAPTWITNSAPGVSYSPAVPGNWSPSPTQVATALDQLAARTNATEYYVNTFTLSPTDISNKFVTLSSAPDVAASTILAVIGGPMQDYSIDFTVSGSQLSWSGLFLDGVLISGDKLVVQFN